MLAYNDIVLVPQRLQGRLLRAPCVASQMLSEITRAQVFLKFEYLQFTASFKERGACNPLAQLSPEQAALGMIAGMATVAKVLQPQLEVVGVQATRLPTTLKA